MNIAEFDTQVSRMKKAFGDRHFNSERAALLWDRFRVTDLETFTNAIDYLILNHRQAPLVDDFGKAIGKMREKKWSSEKTQHANDAKRIMNEPDLIPNEELADLFHTLRLRLSGKMPDKDWADFQRFIGEKYGKQKKALQAKHGTLNEQRTLTDERTKQ